jgi:hypothetical protein
MRYKGVTKDGVPIKGVLVARYGVMGSSVFYHDEEKQPTASTTEWWDESVEFQMDHVGSLLYVDEENCTVGSDYITWTPIEEEKPCS